MNKALKQRISIFCIVVIFTIVLPAANIVSTETDEASDIMFMESVPTDIPYHSGDKYNLIIPAPLDSNESNDVSGDYLWLQDTLATYPIEYQCTLKLEDSAVDMRFYDTNAVPLNIPDVAEIVEVAYSTDSYIGVYDICYYTVTGEYIILEYFSDGRKIKNMRKTSDVDSDILCYDSADESVICYQATDSAASRQSSKQIDFPAPVDLISAVGKNDVEG